MKRKKTNFTIVELLVVIAIMIILASLLFPALGKAKEATRAISCASQLKQFGYGISSYLNDYQEYFPANPNDVNYVYWDTLLMPYVGYKAADRTEANSINKYSFFHCPSGIMTSNSAYQYPYRARGYSFNGFLCRETSDNNIRKQTNPSIILCMVDSGDLLTDNGRETWTFIRANQAPYIATEGNEGYYSQCIVYRHTDRVNILFADFHVQKKGRSSAHTGVGYIPEGIKYKNDGTIY